MQTGTWVITTCMGRLEHLKITAPLYEKFPDITHLVVDYNCPNKSGEWLSKSCPWAKSIKVQASEFHKGRPVFHKAKAQNAGADYAIKNGATHLMFVDVDIIPSATLSKIPKYGGEKFVIPDGRFNEMDLYGFLSVPADSFKQSGGYNENISEYGSEDTDMRLRLFFSSGVDFKLLRRKVGDPIKHSDFLRTCHYANKSKMISLNRNIITMKKNLREYAGKPLEELCKDAETRANLNSLIIMKAYNPNSSNFEESI